MRWLFIFLLALAALGCMGLTAYNAFAAWLSDPVTVATRQEQLRQAQDAYNAWVPRRDALLSGAVVAADIMQVVIILFVSAVGAVVVIRLWDGRVKTRYTFAPDKRGLFPVTPEVLNQTATIAITGYHAAQIERARNTAQPIPSSVTHYTYKQGNQALPRTAAEPALPAPQAQPAALPVPDFATIMRQGFAQNGRILIGLTAAHDPVYVTPQDLLSTAVVGVPGSGKTSTGLLTAAQAAALCGARLALVDPHMGNAQGLATGLASLEAAFWREPVSAPDEALRLIADVLAEMERRKRGAAGPHLLLCVDEFTALMRGALGERIAVGLETVAQEGRKYNVTAMLLGQSWVATRSGGTPLRDSLASAILHRCKPQTARAVWPGMGRDVLDLRPGEAFLARATDAEAQRLAVPLCTPADVATLAKRLPAPSEPYPTGGRSDAASWSGATEVYVSGIPVGRVCPAQPAEPTTEPTETPDNVIPFRVPVRTSTPAAQNEPKTTIDGVPVRTSTPEAAKVIELFDQGVSRNSICTLVYGGKTPKTLRLVNEALIDAGRIEAEGA